MIVLIIVTCFILYKSGAVARFLDRLKLDPDTVAPEDIPPAPPEEGRQKWEAEARYILTKQGQINPDTIKYMGDEMLLSIIRDYLEL